MSDALAFGPAPKPKFGFFKKHRIITWIIAFVMTVTSAAFAAWVVSNILTTTQNSKAKIGSVTTLTNITTLTPTDAEVASTCPAPGAGQVPTVNCDLTLKVINGSGQNVILTQLQWAPGGLATVSHPDGPVCTGSYTALPAVGSTANFLVGGTQSQGSPFITYAIPGIPVPQGESLVVVPNAFGINPNGVDGNFCANSAVSFDTALHTVTFTP